MKNILLLTDFTETANRAADLALQLAVTNKVDLILYNSIILLESGDTFLDKRAINDELVRRREQSNVSLAKLSDHLLVKSGKDDPVINITRLNGTGQIAETIQKLT